MGEFSWKAAFITGAAHGQGPAAALLPAEPGADIIAFDAAKKLEYPTYGFGSGEELESLKEAVEGLEKRAFTAAGDVRDDAAIAGFGWICAYAAVDTMTDDEWNAMIDINLVTGRVAPYMIKAKSGVIINNSSVMGLRGGKRLSHYVASKWGLTGLTKAWAIEPAPHNIRVLGIHPTAVNLLPAPWIEAEDVARYASGAQFMPDAGPLGV